MRPAADIAVFDENDDISALVEVKAVPQSSPEWAAGLRSEIIAKQRGFTPHYFLVVARDFLYIWTAPAPADALPEEALRTDELFQYYLDLVHSDSKSIDPSALEFMVGIWLSRMTREGNQAGVPSVEKWGLSSAIANGRIEFLTAA